MQDSDYLHSLVLELAALPHETGWVEFKENNEAPDDIGEYISAMANTAALKGKAKAYVVWGIRDADHALVGTSFDPIQTKIGNQELESWLLQQLSPKLQFAFHAVEAQSRRMVVLEIDAAFRHPVQFKGVEWIRVGSYKKRLKDFPEMERSLWRILDQTPYEQMIAAQRLSADEALALLDYPAYFEMMGRPLPNGRDEILNWLAQDHLIARDDAGLWQVLNLGAILFARRLSDFTHLKRKTVRVMSYRGNHRMETIRELESDRGYAAGFESLIGFINNLVPSNEVIGQALRKDVPMYPELAVRELVANMLIHQDFSVTGTGPTVEIFTNRLEITNPGVPMMDTNRLLDHPPRSRNETMASMMRRVGICEERGSGVDKVVLQTEIYQLPAPDFTVVGESMRSTLFAMMPLTKMDKADRIRAVYLHACLRYVQREFMTNTSLRERFGIEDKNTATASRLIRESLDDGLIRLASDSPSLKLRRYVPYWA